MSSAIVLPTLTQWTQQHLTAIYQATSQSALDSALDAFLSKDATITVNGNSISRDNFAKQIQTEKTLEAGAVITFVGTVEAPTNPDNHFDAGSVGVFYNVIIQEIIRVRDAALSKKITASLNVDIEQDPLIPVPPPTPIHGFSDRRRVKKLNQVFIEAPVPFNI